MKKRIFAVVALCILTALCMCSCSGTSLAKLNKMAHDSYSAVLVEVFTSGNGETLASKFDVANADGQSTVTYSIEQFTEISLPNVPQGYKTVTTGTVVVKDGKIVSQDGEAVDLSFDNLSNGGLSFKLGYFQNAKTTGDTFTAKVKNPNGFLGCEVDCLWMNIVVTYGDSLNKVTVNYQTSNNYTVKLVYTFTK